MTSVKIDSDKVAKLAQQYAQANGLTLAEMNFELKKDGAAAAPLWNVSCLDAEGNEIGHLVLTATKGMVVSHEGFTSEPSNADKAKDAKEPKDKDPASPVVAETDPRRKLPTRTENPPNRGRPEVKRAVPVEGAPDAPADRKPFFQRAGNTLQHLFTGHDSASRPTPAPPPPPAQ